MFTVEKITSSPGQSTWIEFSSPDGKISAMADSKLSLAGLAKGTRITLDLEKKTSKAGKPYSIIKSFLIEGSTQPISASTMPVTKNGLSEPELRFISNVVGNAITAKSLMTPGDVKYWVREAYDALKTINTPAPVSKPAQTQNPNPVTDLNDSIDF